MDCTRRPHCRCCRGMRPHGHMHAVLKDVDLPLTQLPAGKHPQWQGWLISLMLMSNAIAVLPQDTRVFALHAYGLQELQVGGPQRRCLFRSRDGPLGSRHAGRVAAAARVHLRREPRSLALCHGADHPVMRWTGQHAATSGIAGWRVALASNTLAQDGGVQVRSAWLLALRRALAPMYAIRWVISEAYL